VNRVLYLVAAGALAVIAVVSIWVATTVQPKDIAQNADLSVLANSVPSIAAAKGWINTPPLTPADLSGKVVLYDFWTYSCVNCQRTFPHLKALYDRYKGDGLVIVGIHSPEFDFEKDHDNVTRAVQHYGVTWPVALDDDMAIWNAFTNQYWPAEYLTDQQGRLRQVRFGEGDYDAKENDIRTLLHIPAGAPRAAPAGSDQIVTAAITPEIHFGLAFGGDQFNASPEGSSKGTRTYSLPTPVPQDTYSLSGSWSITDQGAECAAPGCTFVLRYRGAEVNLVAGAGPATAGAPVNVVIDNDGTTLTPLSVQEHDLYNVVSNGAPGYHTLTFRPQSVGLQVFAFTFGAGTR
jgi:thiol-disulfide isomerase/thioredoxin